MARRIRHLLEFAVFRTIVAMVHAMPMWAIDIGSTLAAFCVHRLLPRRIPRHAVAPRTSDRPWATRSMSTG
ncbi:MAG: hypothetical protein Ct9H300mP1_27920 [Planctomycetaceae bacterium]|nr:MAG: hypothetical protein Ct9H300mP1_27920 [Planctomycetaceae bacterium]